MHAHRSWIHITLATCVALAAAGSVSAQDIGRRVTYQGQLVGVTSPVTLVFRIFQQGFPVWGPEEQLVNLDTEGRFVAVVGSSELDNCTLDPMTGIVCGPGTADGTPDLDQLSGRDLELEVGVRESSGVFTVLSPRQQLFPAFHAASAESVVAGGVNEAALVDGAVTEVKLGDGSVTEVKLADDAVTGAKIAADSVGSGEIVNGSVTGTDIAGGTVSFDNLSSSARNARHYLRNDILLRLGPCPSGFSDRSSTSGTLATSTSVGEGQEIVIPNRLGGASNAFLSQYFVRICRCNLSVCN